MATQGKKWIVRDGRGHIYGPFDLKKMQELVRKGIITGEEQAAHYPAGDWGPMSADKELYDLVLASLSDPLPSKGVRKKTADESISEDEGEPEENTPVSFKPQDDEPSTVIQFHSEKTAKTKIAKEKPDTAAPKFQQPQFQASLGNKTTIELTDKTTVYRKGKLAVNFVPVVLLLAAAALIFVGNKATRFTKRSFETINLLTPHIQKTPNPASSEAMSKKGWDYFYKDTFSNYVQSEESFVKAVEENPKNTEAILMLVFTDLQLWPFTRQDGSDQSVVEGLLQLLSQEDRNGTKRPVASAAVDVILGHDASARSQIDSSLIALPAEGRLYQLDGQILFDLGQYQEAMGYFEKVATLLPYWVRPIYMMGLCSSHLSDGGNAQKYLLQALKMNPAHSAARMELGITEAKFYNHEDKAREYLTVALDGEERILPSDESRGRYFLAVLLDKAGDRAGARKQAEEALKLDPSDPDLKELLSRIGGKISSEDLIGNDRQHMVIGDQYMRSGNYLGAQAQYKAAFLANPKNARAGMKAAEALWKLHQSSEAMEFLQKSIQADPKFTESYVLLADYESQRFDFDGAGQVLAIAMKANPKSYEVFRGYGELFFRRGDLKSAEVYATRALALYEIDVKTNILMSKIQVGKKDFVKAMEYGKRAVDLDKASSDAQVNYAKVLAAYEGVKNAVAYLNELINTYPTQLAFRVGLAELLVQDEQYSYASQVLTQVLAADENNKDAYLLMGDAQAQSNKLDDALVSYLAAARVDPSDPTALFRSGEVYLKANKPEKAKDQFKLILKVNPLFPRVHYEMARAEFTLGMTEDAIKDLEAEKKLNPGLADPYEFQGDLYLATRKYQQANKEYQKASEIKQGAGIYVKMAKAYRGQGAFDAALAMLRLATQKESGMAEIYKELGYVYDAKGMGAEAVASFQQYLRLEPNSPDKSEILVKINQLQ